MEFKHIKHRIVAMEGINGRARMVKRQKKRDPITTEDAPSADLDYSRSLIVDHVGFLRKIDEMDDEKGDYAERWVSLAKPVSKALRLPSLASPPLSQVIVQWASRFPHCVGLTEGIQDIFAISRWSSRPTKIPPILLTGPAGIGKTTVAIELARILGVPSHVELMSQASARFLLTGSTLTWASGRAGSVLQLLMRGFGNPVLVLDELDKSGASYSSGGGGGAIDEALLGLLEPVTSKAFKDEALDWPIDVSNVGFIATANEPDRISRPVLSRFITFEVREPTRDELLGVIVPSIYEDLRMDLGLSGKLDKKLPEELAAKLAANPRTVRKQLTRLIGRAAREQRATLTVDMLEKKLEDAVKKDNAEIGFLRKG